MGLNESSKFQKGCQGQVKKAGRYKKVENRFVDFTQSRKIHILHKTQSFGCDTNKGQWQKFAPLCFHNLFILYHKLLIFENNRSN